MKRFLRTTVLAGAVSASLVAAPAASAPTYGNDDLKGEFLFTVLEVRTTILPGGTIPVTEHCVIAGSAVFDGAGTMSLAGRQRCSRTGAGELSGTQYYAVNPDGSFLISESADMSDPVHGRLAEHGRTLLLDGTTRTLPEIQSWSGIAMRR